MIKNLSDKALLDYYRIEYFKEWHTAWKNGIRLTAEDIRLRLNLN